MNQLSAAVLRSDAYMGSASVLIMSVSLLLTSKFMNKTTTQTLTLEFVVSLRYNVQSNITHPYETCYKQTEGFYITA